MTTERTFTAAEKLAARKSLILARRCAWLLAASKSGEPLSTRDVRLTEADIREANVHARRVLGEHNYRRAGGPEL